MSSETDTHKLVQRKTRVADGTRRPIYRARALAWNIRDTRDRRKKKKTIKLWKTRFGIYSTMYSTAGKTKAKETRRGVFRRQNRSSDF